MCRRPRLPDGFQGRVFKGKIWGEGDREVLLFRLVDGEITGWC